VYVWDDNPKSRATAEKDGYNVADLADVNLNGFDALVVSPGIPLTHPKPHPAVAFFRAAKLPVIGDIELLFRACPNATYVGITGTNGKSTTTALIGHILKKSGRKVQVGGNLGTPALSLDPLGGDGIYVLELSSYQLDLFQQNLIRVAVFLNVTPDHLDRHGSMEGYIAAKKRILSNSQPQTLVLGTDEPDMLEVMRVAKGKRHILIEEISMTHGVASGVELRDNTMVAHRLTGTKDIIDLSTLPALPGVHNWQNASAAFAACRALGLMFDQITRGLKTFPGLAHRQQLVAEINGVRFINDSKATNADASSKALACYKNIYWIIGGKPKDGGLKGLENFTLRLAHAFLIGAASDDFADWCATNKVPFTRCNTLDVAVQKAADKAWKDKKPEAVVLLSPACASFDQFNNFEERGQKFAELVQELTTSPQAAAAS
ncbi:MAG TPA: UDP-N-acetylmuramoyl-L-alanine--D-glutamate ligase, partial [Alphaproteobacteria bacterium]|nr:UDP-N-acetylmuramoyl-L-alanine--D-glutamate ligase [Alphaproteobacteria bacterium]